MPGNTIVAKLLTTTAVTDLVVQCVRSGMLDSADEVPGIVVERVTKNPMNTAGAPLTTKFATVMVGCMAETYVAAETLADLVEATLNGYTNTGGTPSVRMVHVQSVSYDPGPRVAGQDQLRERFVIDCFVQYTE